MWRRRGAPLVCKVSTSQVDTKLATIQWLFKVGWLAAYSAGVGH